MSEAIQKPCTLLRKMAERQGSKISVRDVIALQLAIRTMEEMDLAVTRYMGSFSDEALQSIKATAKAAAMEDGMRALLEVHS